MRLLKKVMRWIFTLISIFVLGLSVGYGLAVFSDNTDTPAETDITPNKDSVQSNDSSDFEPNLIDQLTPAPDSVDSKLIEDTIFDLVNDLRSELGVGQLQKNEILRLAANIRAAEIEESFSHTRPNGTEPFTVLQEDGTIYPYYMAGENLAMATYYRGDEHMAQLLFNGWVESEDHYQTMINPDFKEIGIGVHYDGEILYATQFFGTQQ